MTIAILVKRWCIRTSPASVRRQSLLRAPTVTWRPTAHQARPTPVQADSTIASYRVEVARSYARSAYRRGQTSLAPSASERACLPSNARRPDVRNRSNGCSIRSRVFVSRALVGGRYLRGYGRYRIAQARPCQISGVISRTDTPVWTRTSCVARQSRKASRGASFLAPTISPIFCASATIPTTPAASHCELQGYARRTQLVTEPVSLLEYDAFILEARKGIR